MSKPKESGEVLHIDMFGLAGHTRGLHNFLGLEWGKYNDLDVRVVFHPWGTISGRTILKPKKDRKIDGTILFYYPSRRQSLMDLKSYFTNGAPDPCISIGINTLKAKRQVSQTEVEELQKYWEVKILETGDTTPETTKHAIETLVTMAKNKKYPAISP